MASNYNGNQGWKCPECGTFNSASSNYCTVCGRRNTHAGGGRSDISRGGGDSEESGGRVLKMIAVVLVCLLVAVALGFGISKLLLRDADTVNVTDGGTEQGDDSTQVETGDDGQNDQDTNTDEKKEEEPTPVVVEEDDKKEPEPVVKEDPYFKVGKAYKVVEKEGVKVRKGPSKKYEQLKRKKLSQQYYDQSLKGEYACLKQGATVYCISMKGNWMEISDGWVAVRSKGDDLIR